MNSLTSNLQKRYPITVCPKGHFDNRTAHSSRGLGHLPLKEKITGSNPVCATKLFNTPYKGCFCYSSCSSQSIGCNMR